MIIGFEKILKGKNGCPYTDREEIEWVEKDVILYKDDYGSYRFAIKRGTLNVSALQCVTNGGPVTVANVITIPKYRRKGLATRLYRVAEKYFGRNINHSTNLSEDGKAWKKSLQ